jgi:hypothetical protein
MHLGAAQQATARGHVLTAAADRPVAATISHRVRAA